MPRDIAPDTPKKIDDPAMADDQPLLTRRLHRLLAHLKVTAEEFATATGLKSSYVSRLLSGERGSSGDAPKLFLRTAEEYGLDGRYWSARDDLDPAECLRSAREEAAEMEKASDMRAGLARLSADRDDPSSVVKELMRVKAPADADAMWWVRYYLQLLDAHR